MKKLILSLVAVLFISTIFISCNKDKNTDPDNNNDSKKKAYVLQIDNGAQSVELKNDGSKGSQTTGYTASLIDQDGNVTNNYAVTWTSSDNDILSFDANGMATLKKQGTVTITASATVDDSTYTAKVPLSIQLPTLFAVAPSAILYEKGGELDLEPIYFSLDGSNPTYTYSSDNNNVATVSSTGKVSFVGAGSCVITVTASLQGNPAFYVPVVVFEAPEVVLPVTRVELNKHSVDLLQDETAQLSAKAFNPDGEVTGKTFAWTSLNSNVASVDQNGNITPHSAGTTYIKATCDGIFDQAEVIVYPDTMVFITPFYAEINAGNTYQFTAKAYKTSRTVPTVEYNVNFKWEMMDFGPGFEMFNIGTVDQNGLVSLKIDATPGMSSFVAAYDPNNISAGSVAMVMVKVGW